MFSVAEDDEATELDEVVVTGTRIDRLPTAIQITIDDVAQPPSGETGGSGGGSVPDDDCPWDDFYGDSARVVGLFAGVLGALKDSPFTFDPRDDRAIERALVGIDSIEMMLQSQTLDYATLSTVLASSIEIVLSEGTII